MMMLTPILAATALVVAFLLGRWIKSQPSGSGRMIEIAGFISKGTMAFLKREYQFMAIFIAALVLVLGFVIGWTTSFFFVNGAVLSVLAGYFGMKVAVWGNVRTANAADTKGLPGALKMAFRSGAVMGLCVVGLGLLGLSYIFIYIYTSLGIEQTEIITGFGLGASSMALFGRVGGGIYTKAADVGADLVGKVEAGIPEDDPRNPGVIADNVGDNVGDVAGMGSDLFESYVNAIIAAITLAIIIPFVNPQYGDGFALLPLAAIVFPFFISAIGVVASIIGVFSVRVKEGGNPTAALNLGSYISSAIVIAGALILSYTFFGNFNCAIAIIAGLFVGIGIGKVTEIYTSADFKHMKHIAEQTKTGPATTVIGGLSIGMLSTLWPVIFIVIGIFVAYGFSGLYGIALAAVGMLSTTGIIVSVDAYGPVADNAGGIAEMTGMRPEVRKITDGLDSIGNTTAAIGKGFAIGSAALTALALFASYTQVINIMNPGLLGDLEHPVINLVDPAVIKGLLIGATLPFLFAAITIGSVGKAAFKMIEEIRRQFREDKGIMEGTSNPDYAKCVDISTTAALREMIMPGIIAIVVPLVVGVVLGAAALGGLLAGALATGVVLALMMANAGGAWDNAKKYIEAGNHGGKGSSAHKAGVVGDTVGDPLKDTAAPSINILIKLMTIVAIVFAPLFGIGLLG